MTEFFKERPAGEFLPENWQVILRRIPTIFGRLEFLSRGLACNPEAEAERRMLHHEFFSQWLTFNLERQKLDFETFSEAFGEIGSAARYRGLIPAGAREVERQLYLTDLETVLSLVQCERSGAFDHRAAWQLPSPVRLRRFLPGTERPQAAGVTPGGVGR